MSGMYNIKKLFPPALGGWGRLPLVGMASFKYLTPRKIANFLRCEYEVFRRRPRPTSKPYVAIVDVTNICNLKCPYCPTGRRRDGGRKRTMVDPTKVKGLIEELHDFLISANLYNWGEPLLHPKIVELVEMFHQNGIYSSISSNLNANDGKVLEDLCDAGLDYLVVSLSGATQETHQKYHVNGNIDLLIENARSLVEYKNKKKSLTPLIEFHYLVFKHNKQEIEQARRLAKDIGVDIFRFLEATGPEEATVDNVQNDPKKLLSEVGYCHQLWHLAVLNCDGGIVPCYYLFDKGDDFDRYAPGQIIRIRQNDRFVTARKLFSKDEYRTLAPDLDHPCLKCYLVHQQPHLKEYLETNPHAVQTHRTGSP